MKEGSELSSERMFSDIGKPSGQQADRKWYVLPLSILLHGVIAAVVVIIPLIATGVLPTPVSAMKYAPRAMDIVLPAPPPVVIARPQVTKSVTYNPHAAPTVAPPTIGPEIELPKFVPGPDLIPRDGPITRLPGTNEPPPGPVHFVPPSPPPAGPIRVGGSIKQPTKIVDVRPVYPPIAQSARVSGIVIIEAVIGPTGDVQEARVLRSVPLLDQAALQAVRQWKFTPTLLNGVPVPVVITVTVNFTLQ